MTKLKMSLFMPPISPVIDRASGQTILPPTLKPFKEVGLLDVYELITHNKRLKTLTETVREAARNGEEKTYRMLKQQTLPYVTPCGVFSYRRGDRMVEPSGLVVVDIDHLDSLQEAEEVKHRLFDDPLLSPALTFISPGGHGVKAFIPYASASTADVKQTIAESVSCAMIYIQSVCSFETHCPDARSHPDKGVDQAGKDPARTCFLSHDEGALIRLNMQTSITNN